MMFSLLGREGHSPRGKRYGRVREKFSAKSARRKISRSMTLPALPRSAALPGHRKRKTVRPTAWRRVSTKGVIRTDAKHLGIERRKTVADYLPAFVKLNRPDAACGNRYDTPNRTSPEKRAPSRSKKKSQFSPLRKLRRNPKSRIADLQLHARNTLAHPKKYSRRFRNPGIPGDCRRQPHWSLRVALSSEPSSHTPAPKLLWRRNPGPAARAILQPRLFQPPAAAPDSLPQRAPPGLAITLPPRLRFSPTAGEANAASNSN